MFIIVLIVLIIFYIYIKNKKFEYLRRFGYDGPRPSLLKFGNYADFKSKENSINKKNEILHYSKTLQRWSRKYGKIYGYYESTNPVLVLADADLVKDVFLTKDSTTQHRRTFSLAKDPDAPDANVFNNNGVRWQRVRKYLEKVVLNKNNVHNCLHYFESSFDLATNYLNNTPRQVSFIIELYEHIRSIIANTIFQTMFGMRLSEHFKIKTMNSTETIANNSDKNELDIRHSKDLVQRFITAFKDFESASLIRILSLVFNEMAPVWNYLVYLKDSIYLTFGFGYFADPLSWFRINYSQIQFNHHMNSLNGVKNDEKYYYFKDLLTYVDSKCLTMDEVMANTLLLFFGGFETTSTATVFACHVLLTNKDECNKLKLEINSVLDRLELSDIDGKPIVDSIDHKVIDEMKYLDLFVKEVLRMFPVANSMVSRSCVEDNFYIGENKEYFIPKGINIVVDVLSIHYNKDLWGPEDPSTFYPNRFLQKRHPAAWLPFGIGARKCLGIKLALYHIKLFIVKLLCNFDIESISNNQEKADIFESLETREALFNSPIHGVFAKLRKLY